MLSTIRKLIMSKQEKSEVEVRGGSTLIRKSGKRVLTLLVTVVKIIMAAGSLFILGNSLLIYVECREPELQGLQTTDLYYEFVV